METSYFAHETAVIDSPCEIGKGTQIWHFSHIMANCFIGEQCSIGQNVVIYPATLILKGAVVEEGTVFGRLDINSPIVVKQNQYIDKGVYLALENVMNKEVLNYKVD